MALDIQSRRRKAKDKETLAKRLAKERIEKREKEREEKELSRITGNPLTALSVERPNAPEIKEGVSLRSLTGNPAATVRPNSPPKGGGPIDWDSVAESNPGQPKTPVVFIPPGSQEAEAKKVLPGGKQGPVGPPGGNTISQFSVAAQEAAELAEIDEEKLAAAIASGNEGKQETSGIKTEGLWSDLPGMDAEEATADDVYTAEKELLDDIDSNLQAQLEEHAAENPIDIEADQEADPEALAEEELFPERNAKNQPGDFLERLDGMMNAVAAEEGLEGEPVAAEEGLEDEPVAAEEGLDGPVAAVNPIHAARAKRRSAEFWAQRFRAPIQDVMDTMNLAEQELLIENPNATPEEIKVAQIVALETDPGLARHQEVHKNQIQANVQRQADQTNRARIMGVPRGMVMMLDQINDAETPDAIVKGLITASGVYPQFRPMLQSVITGQVSANALKSQLTAAMLQMESAQSIALLNRPIPPEPERTPQAIANDLRNPTFDSQGVQKVSFGLLEGGLEGASRLNQVALSFGPQMRSVGQQILSEESPIQADLNTAREVIQLATGGEMPSAPQVNRLFGGGMTGSQIEKVMHLLYGEAGLRNLHTGGNLRGVAKDWTGVDPATFFGFDDLDNVG